MQDQNSEHIVSRVRKVLVIDDDPAARMTVRAILEDEGYSVTCAEDGRRGLEAFRKLRPDLVVTDIVMPEKEGIETILELRSIWPKGPIIAISGGGRTGNIDYLRLAQGMGANAVLMKPFDPAELLTCIRACQ
jgi:DNA-binding response OmpR family regulator